MLVLSRKTGEQIVIGDNIRLTVVEVRGNRVKIGIEAPGDVAVFRSELRDWADPAPVPASVPTAPTATATRRARLVRRSERKPTEPACALV